jgi:hypothetical protein
MSRLPKPWKGCRVPPVSTTPPSPSWTTGAVRSFLSHHKVRLCTFAGVWSEDEIRSVAEVPARLEERLDRESFAPESEGAAPKEPPPYWLCLEPAPVSCGI